MYQTAANALIPSFLFKLLCTDANYISSSKLYRQCKNQLDHVFDQHVEARTLLGG